MLDKWDKERMGEKNESKIVEEKRDRRRETQEQKEWERRNREREAVSKSSHRHVGWQNE